MPDLKVLHVAPFNTAGVPFTFVQAERALEVESRLITLGRNRFGYPEDICLDLPWLDNPLLRLGRRLRYTSTVRERKSRRTPPVWSPSSRFVQTLFLLRDRLWLKRLERVLVQYNPLTFDLFQLDGGHGFLRSGRLLQKIKEQGKRVVCVYQGSDLRIRGVIPAIDAISDMNFTMEFDHLALYPGIRFLLLPFDSSPYRIRTRENQPLRLFHSTTNRYYKGSGQIIQVGRELEREQGVEFVFAEGLSHAQSVALKQSCDIVIDQIANRGGVGYGSSSLEALAMGIPTCTNLTPEHEALIPDHPFVKVTPETLKPQLSRLIEDHAWRQHLRRISRPWVEATHGAERVVRTLYQAYEEAGWIDSNWNYQR